MVPVPQFPENRCQKIRNPQHLTHASLTTQAARLDLLTGLPPIPPSA